MTRWCLLLILLLAGAVSQCKKQFNAEEVIASLRANPSIVEISAGAGVELAVRYNSENNFMKKNVYQGFQHCFLHRVAADKFKKALALLQKEKPGYSFLVFDCLRPRSIQRQLFRFVKGTPQQKYVADPDKGSIHNYGMAIDLSLQDSQGSELDMGTPYDSFAPLAEPQLEKKFLGEGKLNKSQVENRGLLRKVMTGAGFIQLPHEWWHYDALAKDKVKSGYSLVE